MDEYYERIQQEEINEDEICAAFDPENKTLLTRNSRPLKITNKLSVIASVEKVVKEELTTKKFGNMVGENEPKWYELL